LVLTAQSADTKRAKTEQQEARREEHRAN